MLFVVPFFSDLFSSSEIVGPKVGEITLRFYCWGRLTPRIGSFSDKYRVEVICGAKMTPLVVRPMSSSNAGGAAQRFSDSREFTSTLGGEEDESNYCMDVCGLTARLLDDGVASALMSQILVSSLQVFGHI